MDKYREIFDKLEVEILSLPSRKERYDAIDNCISRLEELDVEDEYEAEEEIDEEFEDAEEPKKD